MPDLIKPTAAEPCRTCEGGGWVCENHLDRPWAGTSVREDACDCGAGAPCGSCRLEMATSGYAQQAREQALEEAAKVAEWAHMVPPDGGSPSEAEYEVARNAAKGIRALKGGKDANRPAPPSQRCENNFRRPLDATSNRL